IGCGARRERRQEREGRRANERQRSHHREATDGVLGGEWIPAGSPSISDEQAMTTFPIDHTAWVLFLWVLGNQAGAPIPVTPAILAAGALAHSNFEFMTVMAVVVGASLCADVAWYSVGRWRGAQVLSPLRLRFDWVSARIDRAANLPLAHEVA